MHTVVSIPGIHCASCSALIQDVSGDFPAIKHVGVDLAAKTVTIEHDSDFSFTNWRQEIESLGPAYAVHPQS